MKPLIVIALLFLLFSSSQPTMAVPQKKIDPYFTVDLNGYEAHAFGTFNQLGYKITPLAQLYFTILQLEHEWIDEPLLYTKGNDGYVHLWKKDGTNVLYKVKKQIGGMLKGMWEIIDVKRTKKPAEDPLPRAFLKEALINRLLDPISHAVESYYGESKLWFRGDERVLKIDKNHEQGHLYITIQIQTFEGAHNPPYGKDTMTFRMIGSGVELVDYKHEVIPDEELSKLKLR